MKNFDIKRFWQVLKWTVLTEKKSIFTAAVAFLCAFLTIQLFSCFTIFDLSHGLGSGPTFAGMMTCAAVIGFMWFYYASGVLGNARTSQQRTTALMLPASNMEKFIARMIYCCILMPLIIYVAAFAATGLRMLLELIAGHDNIVSGLSIIGFKVNMNINGATDIFSSFFDVSMTCWNISLFVLGGVFFHQRPFIWTIVSLVAISIVFGTIFFYIGVMIGEDNIKHFLMNFRGMTFETFDFIASLVFTAFTLFNVWLSYWLYKRLQVVQHKWFNV